MTSKGHALSRDALIRTLTAYSGITTEDGAADGTTLVDSVLVGRNDFVSGKTILIMNGDAKDEDKGATSFNTGDGTITLQGTGFSAQIKAGTIYRILNISTSEIDVANILADIGDASGSTLGSIYAILGNPAQTFLAMIGYEGATSLAAKLTTARAALLDEITALRMAELDAANIPADVDTLNTKVGTNVDAAGTTTVFARLRQIVDTYLADGTIGLAAILADTNELQTDWADGGRLDLLIDAIKAVTDAMPDGGALTALLADIASILEDTGTTLPATLATIAGYIDTEVGAIKTQTDKLAGAAPGVGTATENWNAAEADIVSIGANDTKNKLHSLLVNISALTAAATITIRMYTQINGVERKVYDQDFVKDTDPDGIWPVNGTVGIHEVLRVTAQSDNAGDDGKTIDYDYMLEAM